MNTQTTITKTLVSDASRLEFLPRHTGRQFSSFEAMIYDLSGQFIRDYSGGYWQFYDLSNGGFYMALNAEKPVIFENVENYVEQEMSTDAACIAVNLYALSHLSFDDANGPLPEKYHLLREYALDHPEAGLIMKATD